MGASGAANQPTSPNTIAAEKATAAAKARPAAISESFAPRRQSARGSQRLAWPRTVLLTMVDIAISVSLKTTE